MTTGVLIQLGDVAAVFNGKTPAKADKKTAGHPVLKIKDVDESSRFIGSFDSFVDPAFAKKHRAKAIREGDILILNAAHNADYVGSKQFLACREVDGAIATGEWLIIRADSALADSRFLYHWASAPATRIAIRHRVKGIHLYPKDVAALKLSLPPLKEQKRIAAILGKANKIRRDRHQAIELTDQLLRSVFLDMFGDPVTNQKEWPTKKLAEVVRVVSGATPPKSNPDYWLGSYPWVSPKDMKQIEITDAQDHISESALRNTVQKKVPANAVLIVVRGMILTHTVPICIAKRDIAINQDVKALIAKDGLSPIYLLYSLIAAHNYLLSKVSTAAHGTKRFDMSDILSLEIPIPHISRQSHFEEIEAKCSEIRNRAELSVSESATLQSSLTQRAFNDR